MHHQGSRVRFATAIDIINGLPAAQHAETIVIEGKSYRTKDRIDP